ncbi:MAG: D-amino acid dehydrogenase [Hyphomicrobiales bacterium]|jgi:D-amino-acid dehydrogenase
MTTLVLGAGVIGLATAYALHKDGQDVQIIDRLDGPGLATSFGNAGGLCPGFAGPWAAPGMVGKAIKWMAAPSAPLKIRPRLDPAQWTWLLRFARQCAASRSAANKRAMQAIAHYSQDQLAKLMKDTGLTFDHGKGGVLQTFRSEETWQAGQRAALVLANLGITHRLVPSHEIAQIEPALAGSSATFAGALHLPDDQTGDCAAFCKEMASWLEERGVRFSFGTNVLSIEMTSNRFAALQTSAGIITGERLVLTAGPFANKLLAPLGLGQPIYPVKGYSLTYTLDDGRNGPRSSVMDEDSKLMFTRLGNRVRVGGVAELAGFDTKLRAEQINAIRAETEALFPSLSTAAEPTPWCGFRPMTPDGRARIGAAPGVDGLWLNLGHGSNGWTQAAGAGQLTSDLILGRKPAIDPHPYQPN